MAKRKSKGIMELQRELDVSDCYCEKVKKTGKTASGTNCHCYIKGKPAHLKRIDLYQR